MKIAVTVSRIVVGLLFIFSGLIKANDPYGLSYKMQEFFELWGVSRFHSWTLWFSVLMNAFEIIAGFALLMGWGIRLFMWLLLLLILFFTFLTGYTYVTGQPTNCGCFGDCIPITSKTSFLKDLALTLMIGFLFTRQKKIRPLLSPKAGNIAMLLVTVFSFGIQWYALKFLPVFDCLPYKIDKNINQQMQIPNDAVPDSTVITFVYKKDGKEVEFTADKFPGDFATPPYEFVKRYDKILKKGKNNMPPIKDFILSGLTNEDSTQYVLSRPYAILLFCENFSIPFSSWRTEFEKLHTAAREKNIPAFVITTQLELAQKEFAAFPDVTVFKCDFTAIRTAARTNPAIYLLQDGTIRDKQGYRRMNNLITRIKSLPVQQLPPVIFDTTKHQ